jgi:lipopolysaccharide export system permease protein
VQELHLRFARALICVAVALIGFSALLVGGFSRFGVWRQALGAFLLLIILEALRGVVTEPVIKNPDLWILTYVPTLLGVGVAALFLQISARPISALFRRGSTSQTGAAA